MREQTASDLLKVVKDHPAIINAAITGSRARRTADQFSDLDVLLVARDLQEVCDVRAWLPDSMEALICAFHLSHYCTVLLADFQKIDLAIFSVNEPSSLWVAHDYELIKGGAEFEAQLAQAAETTREKRAVHLSPDVSTDNVLLLLTTARRRVERGELLSAHSFLAMACDMVIALETRQRGAYAAVDILDPRRRLERLQPALAATIHDCLFTFPGDGISRLARHLSMSGHTEMTEGQLKVSKYLLEARTGIEPARQ